MVEVTRKNFEVLLPEIAAKIKDCTFVAIDAEYTGIYSDQLKSSNSLFDSGPQTYAKNRKTASKFTTCQYGVAIFRKDRDSIYRVQAYNFYLFPVQFDAFAKEDLLTCQMSGINFLARHDFDFNKFFKEGVSFLNQEKADSLRSFLEANRHFMNTTEHLDRNYFPDKIQTLDNNDIDEVINRLAGFTKVIDVIMREKKPLVGHNLLTDLLLTYHQFLANLPDSYEDFKKSVHKSFPLIIDTKYLSREIHNLRRRIRPDDNLLKNTNLFALYTNTCRALELNTNTMPIVEPEGVTATKYKHFMIDGRSENLEGLASASGVCHSAGFDAVITGCVFLNLCYMACRPEPEPNHLKGLQPTFSELLGKTEIWSNKLNVARCLIQYVDLRGSDPQPNRPNWILAKSGDGKSIDCVELKTKLVKYGYLEIDAINEFEIIIACGAMGCHRRVLNDLKRKRYFFTEKCWSTGRNSTSGGDSTTGRVSTVSTDPSTDWRVVLKWIVVGIGLSTLILIAILFMKWT